MGSLSVGSTDLVSQTAFRHEAFLYRDRTDFLDRTATFIRAGVDQGNPILVVLHQDKIDALTAVLGSAAERVQFADMATVGRNPARIIPAWQRFVVEHGHEGRPLRGISEPIWAERSADELVECRHHEALLNLAFDHVPAFWLLCPYDSTRLDPVVIAQAHGTHPHVHHGNGDQPRHRYRGVDPLELLAESLPPAPDTAMLVRFGSTLAPVRHFAAARADAAGWSDRAADVALVVSELVANSVRHGGGRGTLRMWTSDAALVCEVVDAGRLTDALVGRREPSDGQFGGRGLWLVNQLCELVQIRSSWVGTTVRIHMRR